MCLYFYFLFFLSLLDIITINNTFHPFFCYFFIPSCCKSLFMAIILNSLYFFSLYYNLLYFLANI